MKSRFMPPIWFQFALLIGTGIYVVLDWMHHPVKGTQALGPVVLISTGIAVSGLLEGFTSLNRLKLEGQRAHDLEPEASEELSRVSHEIVRLVCTAFAIAISIGTLLGLGTPQGIHWSFPFLALGSVIFAIVVASTRLTECARDLKARGLGKGLEGWNGLVYNNKDNPRLWVPKLSGVGYTLNFAHGKSWWMLALLLSPLAILVILLMYLRP